MVFKGHSYEKLERGASMNSNSYPFQLIHVWDGWAETHAPTRQHLKKSNPLPSVVNLTAYVGFIFNRICFYNYHCNVARTFNRYICSSLNIAFIKHFGTYWYLRFKIRRFEQFSKLGCKRDIDFVESNTTDLISLSFQNNIRERCKLTWALKNARQMFFNDVALTKYKLFNHRIRCLKLSIVYEWILLFHSWERFNKLFEIAFQRVCYIFFIKNGIGILFLFLYVILYDTHDNV